MVTQREVGHRRAALRRGDAARAAPGPGRDPARRDARPRDDLGPRSPRPRPGTWCSARCTRPGARAHRRPDHRRRSRTDQQEQIRAQLAVSLVAVISQVLVPGADGGGRVAAFEVMIKTSAIENHIRKNETFKIPSDDPDRRDARAWSCSTTHLLELCRDGTDHAARPRSSTPWTGTTCDRLA